VQPAFAPFFETGRVARCRGGTIAAHWPLRARPRSKARQLAGFHALLRVPPRAARLGAPSGVEGPGARRRPTATSTHGGTPRTHGKEQPTAAGRVVGSSNWSAPCDFRLVRLEKRAVNADNFAVATEERIVSFNYELELVPVVLIQQGLARRPVTSGLDIEPSTTPSREAQLRNLEQKYGSTASFPRRKVLAHR